MKLALVCSEKCKNRLV